MFQQEMSYQTDVLIAGGGMGGVAAALAVTRLGFRAILTEETDWLGGQASSQCVPPDEHRWIEQCGCTATYRKFREAVRGFYRRNYPLAAGPLADPLLNPGSGWVSRLCHEPRVAAMVIEEMLAPLAASSRLRIFKKAVPVAVEREGEHIRGVTFEDRENGRTFSVAARFVLDATELGELLELGKVDFVTGSEGAENSGDLHDRPGARPGNMQAATWVAVLGFDPRCEEGSDQYKIQKPANYGFWSGYIPALTPAWPGKLLSWRWCHPQTLKPVTARLFPWEEGEGPVLWHYRRVLAAQHMADGGPWHDLSVINWPQNDYLEAEILNGSREERAARLENARELTKSLVYWLQNEAPRPDGKCGYAGLYLRPDAAGTADGLAKYPYIRESRRIKALHTVRERDLGVAAREGRLPDPVKASVGVGYYRIDLHPTTGGDNFIDVESFPFQIPLGCLIPVGTANLLAAGKNAGTTHVTNGCFRLHPVEWNLGEAAGALAGFCLTRHCSPHDVAAREDLTSDLQSALVQMGFELAWPASVQEEHLAQIG